MQHRVWIFQRPDRIPILGGAFMMKSRGRFLEGVGATGIAVTIAGSSAQELQINKKYPIREIKLDKERCSLWASTSLHVWPEKYLLVSLPTSSLPRRPILCRVVKGHLPP